jgi:hypothetical protein
MSDSIAIPQEMVPSLWAHLTFTAPTEGARISTLAAQIRDARGAVGRDLDSGHYLNPADEAHAASWLGAVGYLLLLDQIGTCFAVAGGTDQSPQEIKRALEYFAPDRVAPDEINALYALRCSLAHNYSLVNMPPNVNKADMYYRFRLHPAPAPHVAITHANQWDGSLKGIVSDGSQDTEVSLRALGDLVEEIAAVRLPQHLGAGTLAFGSAMGKYFETEEPDPSARAVRYFALRYGFAILTGD